jgi:hypothetical protein
MKFTRGLESPTPRGLAKGVGNGRPWSPAQRCGTLLQSKRPAVKSVGCIEAPERL